MELNLCQNSNFGLQNSVLAFQSLQFSLFNSVLAIQSLRFSPCNSVVAMRFSPCNSVVARQICACNSDDPCHSGRVMNTAPTCNYYTQQITLYNKR